jgi:lysozyme
MNINSQTRALIRRFEGCKLTAYQCSARVWTIGFGATRYEDGSSVKQGDVITQERADRLFVILLDQFASQVRPLITARVNDNQFGALLSFAYNVGVGGRLPTQPPGLRRSTLLRLVNANPSNPAIRLEFGKWNRAGGQVLNGLTRRRQAEADLYFTPIVGQ